MTDGMVTLDIIREAQEMDPLIEDLKNQDRLPKHLLIRKGILIYTKNKE